jgi:hypothetical protein
LHKSLKSLASQRQNPHAVELSEMEQRLLTRYTQHPPSRRGAYEVLYAGAAFVSVSHQTKESSLSMGGSEDAGTALVFPAAT